MHFQNGTDGPLDNFMIQFNKNSFGLAPGSQNVPVPQLGPGSSQTAVLPLVQNPALVSPTAASPVLQVFAASSTYTCTMSQWLLFMSSIQKSYFPMYVRLNCAD